ncbi:GAF domain-containing sensor histidine kinase [Paenibacillus whitsoniae]|uniref:histidine kinase n=1 Tax=Paenibacillus whitsoniae TaxID=2496558 RepID=A0A3S0CDD5_9BACL|nr:ATP-binding protein [Paenibacillus whitsoniae]RTE11382.1 sensor histidine kinase [Paenibacillus whitsoniae]
MQEPIAERAAPPGVGIIRKGLLSILPLLSVVFTVITGVLYAIGIPRYYDKLVATCIIDGCGKLVPAMPLTNAGSFHLSLEDYALLFVCIDVIFTCVYYGAALLLMWKGFREPMAILAALAMVAFGTTFPSLSSVAFSTDTFQGWWFSLVASLGWVGLSLLFLLFPNGAFVPRWTLGVFIFILIVDVSSFFHHGLIWIDITGSEYLEPMWYFGTTLTLLYAQIYRYAKISSLAQRQQTKWVVYGLTVGMIGFLGMSILFSPGMNDGTALTYVYLNAALNLVLLAIPMTLTMAVLRHRLWEIDPLVKRTLVYAALTVCVAALYILSVYYLGRIFETRDNLFVSLTATAIVAVVFAPLKERLQRLIHRMLKGRHDDPYAVLLELGSQLVRPLPPESMLEALADTVKDSLRLPYAGIAIGIGGEDAFVASSGTVQPDVMASPIIHRGERLGTLYVSNRSPGESFSSEDHKFLEVLLQHAGPIVENVNMTLGMKLLAKDLQESREKLVLAREEERRQIRKNLHDDLAPRLAALALNAATAEKYVLKKPDAAIEMLGDLRHMIRATVAEIRTLVHDLRPPSLDELGLLSAIQERINELNKPAKLLADEQGTPLTRIRLLEPPQLPELPAAVEVAAYRIVTESLANVVKHSQATECSVKLSILTANRLVIEVTDNGRGVHTTYPQRFPGKGGIGLQSLRERAAELGGQCTIEQVEQGGTRVMAVLPFYQNEEA